MKMTEIQFNEIKERLTQCGQEKHLTYESQREEFLGNVFDRVSKYFKSKDDLGRVDALCDIAVFYLNSFDIKYDSQKFLMTDDTDIHSVINRSYNMISVTSTRTYSVNSNGYSFIAMLENFFNNLGFDFYKCMLETIKEIESRTGYYDKEKGKFIENDGAYTEEEAYKIANKYDRENETELYDETDLEWVYLFPNPIWERSKEYPYVTFTVKKWYNANYENCKLQQN